MTVTQDVLENRGLGEPLKRYVHPQAVLRAGDGIRYGADGFSDMALAFLAACPNAQMLTEDIIWSGAPQVGLLGSQRMLVMATHHGAGQWGEPTGKSLRFRVFCDSYAKDNRISEVWQVRDTAAILHQIGQTPQEWARRQLAAGQLSEEHLGTEPNVQGYYTGAGNADQWGAAFADFLQSVMLGAFSRFPEQYDRACQLDYPGMKPAFGTVAAEAFWMGLRGSFPSAQFVLHHKIGMEEALLPPRAALRWSLTGKHDGWGLFGTPTGANIHIMGISHAEFGPHGLRREWTLIDELSVWQQIARQSG
ncbi:nuclear transport factor 2 family protein [Thalassococcus lentus]|uniref:Ester cyclase n=1 Tax=Thalassococcus lentus TaxID=1210524 RepID=A0ABT4XXT1_9RHOB|nr:ester cyclase [Thalassococcus lentus]MDA7426780.1 ester cyclase [Thalassococcus lentus]